MRNAFAEVVIREYTTNHCFFLTGDLGFMALEGVRDGFGDRFINCGVAEQNMIGMAAGLAHEGFQVIAYSIAPFCYARPFEYIRNDLAFTKLPVTLVGNGGGYAYGHMGPTHHALEDCAAMCSLGIHVFVPAFNEDIAAVLQCGIAEPNYLRLGYDVRPKNTAAPAYAPWRKILCGQGGTLIALGPLAGLAWTALGALPESKRPELWAACELPLPDLPKELCEAIRRTGTLYIFEEHVKAGGLAMQLLYELQLKQICPNSLVHRYALGYPSGRYGSQEFHRKECGLDVESIRSLFI